MAASVLIAILIDCNAIDMLCNQKSFSRFGDAAIEKPHDVGVIHLRQKLTLDPKARLKIFAAKVLRQDFDRYALRVGSIGALCEINTVHAAAP